MSNCVGIAEDVVREIARPEFVVNYTGGDFTPKRTFLRMINEAHKHLDRRRTHDDKPLVTRLSLAAGEYTAPLPAGLRHVTRIDIEDSAGNILPTGGLIKSTIEALRAEYKQTFDLITRGVPCVWCRNVFSAEMAASSANLLSNGEFTSSVLPWTPVNPGVTLTNISGEAHLAGGAGGYAYMKYDFADPIDLRDARLSFDVKDSEHGWTTVVINNPNVSGFTITLVQSTAEAPKSIDISILEATRLYNLGHGSYLTEEEIQEGLSGIESMQIGYNSGDVVSPFMDVDNVLLSNPVADVNDGLIILPPADKDYTLVIDHAAFAPDMVNNTDVTWWSYNDPGTLILAVKRQIALDINRNKTEVADYDEQIEQALYDDAGDNSEELSNSPEVFRFGWHQ